MAQTRCAIGAVGLALAVGVLAKGPVILVHLMPLVLTMPISAPQTPDYRKAWKGFALALAIGLALVALWVSMRSSGTAEFRTELYLDTIGGKGCGSGA